MILKQPLQDHTFPFLVLYACCSSYCIAPSDSDMFYVKRTLQCKYEAYLWIELSSYFPRGGLWDECLNFLTCFHFQFVLRSQKGESFWWWWFEDTFEFVFWLTVFPFNIFKCWCRGNTILFDVDRAKIYSRLFRREDFGNTIVEFSILLKIVYCDSM